MDWQTDRLWITGQRLSTGSALADAGVIQGLLRGEFAFAAGPDILIVLMIQLRLFQIGTGGFYLRLSRTQRAFALQHGGAVLWIQRQFRPADAALYSSISRQPNEFHLFRRHSGGVTEPPVHAFPRFCTHAVSGTPATTSPPRRDRAASSQRSFGLTVVSSSPSCRACSCCSLFTRVTCCIKSQGWQRQALPAASHTAVQLHPAAQNIAVVTLTKRCGRSAARSGHRVIRKNLISRPQTAWADRLADSSADASA